MTDEKYKPWTDANGEYFDWLQELWVLSAEKKEIGGESEAATMIPASDLRLPKLSFLVNCLRAVRADSDLMAKISDLAKQYPSPDQLPEDETNDLAQLIRLFFNWLELRDELARGEVENLPLNGTASSFLFGILYDKERGDLQFSDIEVIRTKIISAFFIDDLMLDQKD